MKKILVIGELCTDQFVYCSCERLCPEGPVPVLKILHKVENHGMAGNVFQNVLNRHFNTQFISNTNIPPITKTRYVEEKSNHLFLRIDSDDKIVRIEKMRLHSIRFSEYDCVIVSDYNKGFLETSDLEYIARNSRLSFIDTKKILGNWVNGFTFIKINELEFQKSKQFIHNGILSKTIITLGDRGCQLNGVNYPLKNKVEALDVSGAGDTFLAALAVDYMIGHDIVSAISEANKAASIAVQKRGVVVA